MRRRIGAGSFEFDRPYERVEHPRRRGAAAFCNVEQRCVSWSTTSSWSPVERSSHSHTRAHRDPNERSFPKGWFQEPAAAGTRERERQIYLGSGSRGGRRRAQRPEAGAFRCRQWRVTRRCVAVGPYVGGSELGPACTSQYPTSRGAMPGDARQYCRFPEPPPPGNSTRRGPGLFSLCEGGWACLRTAPLAAASE